MDTKKCTFCAEDILYDAIKCKHCGEYQDPAVRDYMTYTPQQMNRRWNPGIAALISIFLPGVGHMYKGQFGSGVLWLIFTAIGYMAFVVPGFILHLICIVKAYEGNPYE